MHSNIDYNIVLYDWLSFTSKKHTPYELIEAMGMSHCSWVETKGACGYQDRLYFGSISVHFNGREDMGVWVEMSGQGCRNFEDLTILPRKFEDIFDFIHSNNLNITRLDIAYDDHCGVLDIDTIASDTENQYFLSRMKYWEVVRSSKGTGVYIGSPQSKVRVRIYDKAAERGLDDGSHWVRIELQLRDGRASEFSKIPMDIGEAFAGVLLNYLRFVTPDETDTNKSRWENTVYWDNLIGDIGRIKIYTLPGGDYNVKKLKDTVINHWGNAIDCALKVYGSTDEFLTALNGRHCAPNPKYELLLNTYYAQQEAWAAKVRQYINIDESPEVLEEL